MSELKTVVEWFRKLPNGIKQRAILNMVNQNLGCATMSCALEFGMEDWGRTEEGADYWCKVFDHYEYGSKLPKRVKK